MERPIIEGIFLDFGNVCATFSFRRFIGSFATHTGIPHERVEAVLCHSGRESGGYSPIFRKFECGELSPAQFFHELTTLLDCVGRISFAAFAHLWTDIFFDENRELDRLLEDIPQKKFLLSNTNKIVHGRYIAFANIVRRHVPTFGDRIMSYRVGALKPHPAIFVAALRHARIPPERAVFIDDRLENIAGWRALGGIGLHYNMHTDSISNLEYEFDRLGMLR